jgi:hypothetical protein
LSNFFFNFFLSLGFSSVFFFSGFLLPKNPSSSSSSPKPCSFLSDLDSFIFSFGLTDAFPWSSSSEPSSPKSPPKLAFFASYLIALTSSPLALSVLSFLAVFFFFVTFDFS